MCANRPMERSGSEHCACSGGEPCSRSVPVGQGLPQPRGGITPLRLDRRSVTLCSHTSHASQKPIPAAKWGSAVTSGWEFCVSHSKIHSPHVHPMQHEIPAPLQGPGHPRNPQMGRRGQGETVFKTLQP